MSRRKGSFSVRKTTKKPKFSYARTKRSVNQNRARAAPAPVIQNFPLPILKFVANPVVIPIPLQHQQMINVRPRNKMNL